MMIKPSSRVGTKKRLWPGVIQVRGASFGRRDDRIRTCDPLILFASLMTCDGAVTPSLTCGCGSCRLPSSLVFRRCRVARMWHVLAVGDPGLSLQVGAFSPSRRPGVARSRRVKGAPWHQPPPDDGTAPLTRRDSPRGGRRDGETCHPRTAPDSGSRPSRRPARPARACSSSPPRRLRGRPACVEPPRGTGACAARPRLAVRQDEGRVSGPAGAALTRKRNFEHTVFALVTV